MAEKNSKDITLLLVGSAGNGKSATGNTILDKPVFKTTAGTSFVVSEVAEETGAFDNRFIRVIECPGVDTDKSPEEVLSLSVKNIDQALKVCRLNFSALLIVLKYGQRFTKQENDMITNLKGILGRNVISECGICVITNGDNFTAVYKDEGIQFEDWCQQQGGDVQKLFQECKYRCVLFNNRTKDTHSKKLQMEALMRLVDKTTPYTEAMHENAKKDLQKLEIETRAPLIIEQANASIKELRKKLPDSAATKDQRNLEDLLKELLTEVDKYKESLNSIYGEYDFIKQPLLDIQILRMEIESKMKIVVQSAIRKKEDSPPTEFKSIKKDNIHITKRRQDKCTPEVLQSAEHRQQGNTNKGGFWSNFPSCTVF